MEANYSLGGGRMICMRTLAAMARYLPEGSAKADRLRGDVLKVVPTTVGTTIYRDRSGHVVPVDLADQMQRGGMFGRFLLPRYVLQIVAEGDWVIDIGANVGLVSSQLCAAVGRAGLVWAIEPLPSNIDTLQDFKRRNRLTQLEVMPFALGARDERLPLRLPAAAGQSGWPSFTKTWDTCGSHDVSVRRLDDLARPESERLRLIKLDVEGYELAVLAGASETLARYRPLVYCEFNDILLRDAGASSRILLQAFLDLGYEPLTLPKHVSREELPKWLNDRLTDLLLGPIDR